MTPAEITRGRSPLRPPSLRALEQPGALADPRGRLLALAGRFLLAEDVLGIDVVHDGGVAFLELAGEDAARERVRHAALDRPAQRARPVDGVVAFFYERRLGGFRELQADLAVGQTLAHVRQEQLHDLLQVFLR